ncbi:MAG TPA: isoprenylcysteine carboxylmethyltransferase family protein [Spirochaetota bacterium]|nr:isoprenylcysteine carboxylmethyltransferase family protein [Spirochaetota bacterium]HNT13207.1 isoprenylcysteine carboxylmethyltransferase family protein [Spirochaetota bacterium]
MELILVVLLFLGYMSLWGVKRRMQKKSSGIDPEVIGSSTTPSQRFFNAMTKVLTAYIVFMMAAHASGIQYYSLFSRFVPLERTVVDIVGFLLGSIGLALCGYAQIKMGLSWRVGIDEERRTALVTTGLYRYIRNPTYLGLFILCAGVWLIWPTWTIALFGLVFYLMLEVQVRCEEEFLLRVHGEFYREYLQDTKRYIPKIY